MPSLIEQLKAATNDLLYPSESESALEPFVWRRTGPVASPSKSTAPKKRKKKASASDVTTKDKALSNTGPVTADEVLRFGKHDAKAQIEEVSLKEFFSSVTTIEDWFGDEEKETAQKFTDLQKLLKDKLRNIKVFRVGSVEITVYVVGIDDEGNLTGLKTNVIET